MTGFFCRITCDRLKNVIHLQCVFHSIRFKVNEDWLSRDNLFFFYPLFIPFLSDRYPIFPPIDSASFASGFAK